jgi:UDP-3-O-[3-hydroxymyristoyl] glucosamine N-acyltransferase
MKITVGEIAEKLRGTLEGDGSAVIGGVAGLREAEPGELSYLGHSRYRALLASTGASAVLVGRDWNAPAPTALIRVDDPETAFAAAALWWARPEPNTEPGTHPTALVGRKVVLGAEVVLGPYCVVADDVRIGAGTRIDAACYVGAGSVIGANCRLYPHVSLREGTVIGHRTVIHNGTVIGSDGFGYTPQEGRWQKIPQVGHVVIGDDVEIGALCAIDRARFGRTRIGNGVKIDNFVQVAHNCRIGDHSAIAAQVGLSGSTLLGRGIQVGGQAGFTGHLRVGDRTVVAGRAGVTKDVEPGSFVSDFPAMPHAKARRLHAHVMRLPDLKKKVEALEARLREMEARREETP